MSISCFSLILYGDHLQSTQHTSVNWSCVWGVNSETEEKCILYTHGSAQTDMAEA
jgi:hypothetical protein